jgi:hypothetical protein
MADCNGEEIPRELCSHLRFDHRANALMRVDREVPPVTPHSRSLHAQFEAVVKAFP